MVPETVNGIVILLLLVLPGLHYDLLRERYRPGRNESPFFEVSRVLLSGVVLSGATLILLDLVHLVAPETIVDYRGLLTDYSYVSNHIALGFWSVAWFLIVSFTLGSCTANAWPASSTIDSSIESTWIVVFARTPQREAARQKVSLPRVNVEIRVKDGRGYRGLLTDYSKDIEVADREIVLEPPINIISADGNDIRSLDREKWHRLILPGSEITGILVNYSLAPSASSRSQLAAAPTGKIRSGIEALAKKITATVNWCFARRNNTRWLTTLLAAELILLFVNALVRRLI